MKEAKGQQKQEDGVDVLDCMVVTAAVFHLERSALNTEAPANAVYNVYNVGGCKEKRENDKKKQRR